MRKENGWSRYTGRRVRIVYVDRRGRWTLRTVVPYAWDGEWMRAHCCERGAPRRFRLDRIMALQPDRTGPERGGPERGGEERGRTRGGTERGAGRRGPLGGPAGRERSG